MKRKFNVGDLVKPKIGSKKGSIGEVTFYSSRFGRPYSVYFRHDYLYYRVYSAEELDLVEKYSINIRTNLILLLGLVSNVIKDMQLNNVGTLEELAYYQDIKIELSRMANHPVLMEKKGRII